MAFIMSASHSGSTLLAMLLGAHPEATTIGDTAGTPCRKDPQYRCSCGRLARECPFWARVVREMSNRGFDCGVGDFGTRFEYPEGRFLDRVLGAEHRGPVFEAVRDAFLAISPRWRRRSLEIARRNVALAEAVTETAGADVLVDSSKQPHRLKLLLRIPELRVKVIHLVRDGRGVAHTYIRDNGWTVGKAAVEWRRSILAAQKLLARLHRSDWTQVLYEDLCAGPRGVLEDLCGFLGLDPARAVLDFRSAGLHVFGNRMRLSEERGVRLDDAWKWELTAASLARFEAIAGRLNRRYGYR